MEKTITVQFGEKIVNTGKTTLQEAYSVALAYGAKKDETIRYRVTMSRDEIDTAIRNLEIKLVQVNIAGLEAAPSRRRDWSILNAVNAERDVLTEKIARLQNMYRNYDSIIDA